MRERTLGWVATAFMLASGPCLGCGGSAGSLDLSGTPPNTDGGAEGGSGGGGASGGGGLTDGGGAIDGATTGSDGGVNPPGAGPGGNTSQIACGSTACTIPGESCCVVSSGGNTAYGCVTGTSCPAPPAGGGDSIALKCSSAANCSAGTVCCVSKQGAVATSACQLTCTASNQAQLCDLNAPSTGCSTSAACSSKNVGDWGLPPTYATCGGVGN